MITALVSAAFGAVVKWVLSCFTTDPREKLGQLEVTAAVQAQEIKNAETKNRIDAIVDAGSPADIKRLSADLDAADK